MTNPTGQQEACDAKGAEPVALKVYYGSMRESNGRNNWTAILHRGSLHEGVTIDRSEYPHRVRYEADRVRFLIGELAEEPWILDYDADERTPCHLCGGSGTKDGKPCWGLKFDGTVHALASIPAPAAPVVAPWPDFHGNTIRHGDKLCHPQDGSEFIAIRLPGIDDDADAWRAVYDGGSVPSRLCLQLGEKGRAALASPPTAAAPVPSDTERDAARYRWLRRCEFAAGADDENDFRWAQTFEDGEALDAAVDAARACSPGDAR